MVDPRVEKWKRRLDRLAPDIETMQWERFVRERMVSIIEANPRLRGTGSSLWIYLFGTYAKTQAVAVRRQAEIAEEGEPGPDHLRGGRNA